MKNLFSLLERVSQVLYRDRATKEAISGVIHLETKVSLKPENFSLKDGVLTLEASAVAKNEIRLKEEIIKKELAKRGLFISRIIYK